MDETYGKILAFIPCATGSLSVIGSFLTLLTIYRIRNSHTNDGTRTPLRTYQRLLVGISLSDIMLSISLALGPFPAPASPSIPWGRGTTATCTFQGAFIQLGSASFCYSLMLMIYYILVIRYNKSDAWISTWAEPIMHVVPIGFFVSTTIAGIVRQVFNPSRLRCWYGVYPRDCLSDPDVACERGGAYDYTLFAAWLHLVPLAFINFLLVSALVIISYTVWQQHASTQGFVVGDRSRRQTQQVIVQCFLYALCFINAMIWTTMGSILALISAEYDDTGEHFWVALLTVMFFPLQGLFSFLVYIRPRFLNKRQAHRDLTLLAALWDAVWNPSPESQPGLDAPSSSRARSSTFMQSRQRPVSFKRSPSLSGNAMSIPRSSTPSTPSRQTSSQEEDSEAFVAPTRNEWILGRASKSEVDVETAEQTTIGAGDE